MAIWRRITLGVATTLWLAAAGLVLTNPKIEYRISEAMAQKSIDAKLPFSGDRGALHYQIDAAAISFTDADRAEIMAEIHLQALGLHASARVRTSAVPSYHDDGFYLQDIQVASIEMLNSNLPENTQSKLRGLIGQLSGSSKETLEQKFGAALSAAFEDRPIYRLKPSDFRHTVARAVLSDLRIEHQQIVATLDPLGAALRLAAYAVLGLLSLVVVVVLLLGFVARNRSEG